MSRFCVAPGTTTWVLEGFSDLSHDDEVDACSGALEMLNPQMKGSGQIPWT